MFVTMNRIFVNEGYTDGFEQRFKNRAHEVDKMKGFVRNVVLKPKGPEQPYVVMTFWESEDDFNNWVKSDAFIKGHAKSGTLPKEAFSTESHLETFDVFLDTEA
ncbi:MAG TPA: antibiotic biosynthesis monooxygenase [Thermodesulfobacteriota bacterium]|nr:antibiotic biosynthesis monooxygenase [Thermodesulfobacteriota bacterium]